MIASLSPYPDYKPSGVEWLGDVPRHWEVRRLKMHAVDIVDQSNGRCQDEVCIALEHVESWTGKIRRPGTGVSLDSQLKRFLAGDVLFGKLRPYLAKVARPGHDGLCVSEFLVLRPRNVVLSSYLEQVLRTKPTIDAINSSTFGARMPRADWNFIGGMEQPLPPLPEQAAIVRYLEHVDQRIRRYVSSKEGLIRLLEEEKQAFIRRAVTRGIDTGIHLRPSGNEWLGDMPAHWESRRLKTICSMNSGHGITAMSIESTGRYPVYGGNGLRGYSSHFTHEGEFALIGRQGALCGNVHIARGRFWASEHAVVATLQSGQVLE